MQFQLITAAFICISKISIVSGEVPSKSMTFRGFYLVNISLPTLPSFFRRLNQITRHTFRLKDQITEFLARFRISQVAGG